MNKLVLICLWLSGFIFVLAVKFISPEIDLILFLDRAFAYIEKSDKSKFTIFPDMSNWSSDILLSGSFKSISALIEAFFFPVCKSAIVEKLTCLSAVKLSTVKYFPFRNIFLF